MQQVVGSKLSLAILALCLLVGSFGLGAEASESKPDVDSKGGLPASLYRFLLFSSRPSSLAERQANLMGYKRSSGTLDALTGMTLGKRSELALNLEPYFGRHYALRQTPRYLDARWTPSDLYDADSY